MGNHGAKADGEHVVNARLAVFFNFSFFEMDLTHFTASSSIDAYSVCFFCRTS